MICIALRISSRFWPAKIHKEWRRLYALCAAYIQFVAGGIFEEVSHQAAAAFAEAIAMSHPREDHMGAVAQYTRQLLRMPGRCDRIRLSRKDQGRHIRHDRLMDNRRRVPPWPGLADLQKVLH